MEKEVNKDAVEIYKKYEPYKDWVVHGSEYKGREFRSSMTGYYLKSREFPQYAIVGDVLTTTKVWGNAENNTCDKIKEKYGIFKKIYHTNGNYIPIPELKDYRTGNLSGNNCDTFTHHLNICKQAIEGKLDNKNVWNKWAEEIWIPYCKDSNPWDKFVKDYYLCDFVDENRLPISFVVGRNNANQIGIQNGDSEETILATLERCIEFIIKRNYRIEKDIKDNTIDEKYREYCAYKSKFLLENKII